MKSVFCRNCDCDYDPICMVCPECGYPAQDSQEELEAWINERDQDERDEMDIQRYLDECEADNASLDRENERRTWNGPHDYGYND